MIIHSDFSDYYDCGMGMGVDINTVYIRKTEVVKILVPDSPILNAVENRLSNLREIRSFRIEDPYTFTNGILPIILAVGRHVFEGVLVKHPEHPTYLCTSLDDIEEAFKKQGRKFNKEVAKHRRFLFGSSTVGDIFKPYFREYDFVELMEKHNSPVLAFSYTLLDSPESNFRLWRGPFYMTISPQLSPLGVVRKMDPYTTYQELSMTMSGVLSNPEPANIDISDELKRNRKGFDEWSFKRKPTKKRKK